MKKLVVLAASLAIGCGGVVDSPLLDSGTGSDGTTTNDSPATDNCTALLAAVDKAATAAMQCCPTCKSLQCTQQVDGLCCKLTVNGTSDAIQQYQDAVKAVRDAKCSVACPAVVCADHPTMQCRADGTCAQL